MTSFFSFRSYNLLLVLVISCCDSNLAILTWCYFFSLSSFKIFVINIFSVEWFFYYFCNWFCTNFYNPVSCFFSCLEFPFFGFCYLAILDYKCICSFLFSWISLFFNYLLASIKVFIVFDYCFIIYIFLFSYFVSTIVSSLTNLDKCIFCSNFCYSWFAFDLRILNCPSCSFCSNLTWCYNLVFTFFKCVYFFYFIFER